MTRMTFKEDVTTEMMRMAGIEEIEDLQIEDIVADRWIDTTRAEAGTIATSGRISMADMEEHRKEDRGGLREHDHNATLTKMLKPRKQGMKMQ
jgi:hypothetical protein